jgi:hypothetical protein
MKTIVACLLGLWIVGAAHAQVAIRPDDHFWRRRVVQRIDLGEKINRPLVQRASQYYRDDSGEFVHTDGMVDALIAGLKEGQYVAYHPDDWAKTFTYEDVAARAHQWNEAATSPFGGSEEAPAPGSEFEDFEDPFAGAEEDLAEPDTDTYDPFAPPPEEDPFGDPDAIDKAADKAAPETTNDDLGGASAAEPSDDALNLLPFEEVIHVVEDWIFDRNRSMLVKQIDYFEVVWVDPMGALEEKVLARFLWKDVKDQLEETMWPTRFNDAANHSIAHALDLRMFHGYPISVGGRPVQSLAEADRRLQELIEFEHHLWSY